jgi:uncharacterized membrane protein
MYTWYQWLAFFFIYGFFGWIWETSYVSVCQKRFVNRGFLHGPMIPIYAFGALAMLILALPVKANMLVTYVVGMVGATLLELVTGWLMERIFKVRYWDYRSQKFNFHGYICLSSSLFWGFLAVALVNWMHPPVENFVISRRTNVILAADAGCSILFLLDFGVSLKQALDLRKILVSLEKLYKDMEAVRQELAAHLDERLEDSKERMDEYREAAVEKLESGREKLDEYRETAAEKLESGREKLDGYREAAVEKLESGRERLDGYREAAAEKRESGRERRDGFREAAAEKLENRMIELKGINRNRMMEFTAAREKLRQRHPSASFGKWDNLIWQEEESPQKEN